MHKLVHNLTLCIVLYHLLVGCCWHHAHRSHEDYCGDAHRQACVADGERHLCDGAGEVHASAPSVPPVEHQHCHEGHCFFVVPAWDGLARWVGQVHWVATLNTACTTESLTPLADHFTRESPQQPIAAVRLHLLNQILLI